MLGAVAHACKTEQLRQFCLTLLQATVTHHNVCDLLLVSQTHREPSQSKLLLQFLGVHLRAASKSKGWERMLQGMQGKAGVIVRKMSVIVKCGQRERRTAVSHHGETAASIVTKVQSRMPSNATSLLSSPTASSASSVLGVQGGPSSARKAKKAGGTGSSSALFVSSSAAAAAAVASMKENHRKSSSMAMQVRNGGFAMGTGGFAAADGGGGGSAAAAAHGHAGGGGGGGAGGGGGGSESGSIASGAIASSLRNGWSP